MSFRLKVLGGLTLTSDGQPTNGGASQRRHLALLALLAVHSEHGISRERLGALLWPESDEVQSRSRLKQAVYVLRRELGADAILGTVQLRIGLEIVGCDLVDFRRLLSTGEPEAAIAAYAGPFLDGFHLGGDAESFERWVDEERDGIARLANEALLALAKAASATGDEMFALKWWRRLAATDPLDARYARGVATALVATGDRAGALRYLTSHQELLEKELGLAIEPELQRLATAIRAEGAVGGAPEFPRVAAEAQIAPPDEIPLPLVPRISTQAPTTPKATRKSSMRPVALGAGLLFAVVAALGLSEWGHSPKPLDPGLVAVAPYSGTDDDPSTIAVRRLAAEATARLLTSEALAKAVVLEGTTGKSPRDAASHTGAGLVIAVSTIASGSNVTIGARLVDVSTGQQLWSSPQLLVASDGSEGAVALLSERTAVAAGVRLDPLFVHWIGHSSEPSTLASYRDFRRGWELYAKCEMKDAADHLFRAAIRDTGFTLAPIAGVLAYFGVVTDFDSARAVLDRMRVRTLAPLDRAIVDNLVAYIAGDRPVTYTTSQVIDGIAPHSEWRILRVMAALGVGRARESVRTLDEIGRDSRWFYEGAEHRILLAGALHLLGDHQRELDEAQKAHREFPTNRDVSQSVILAEVALGRIAEVEREMDQAMTLMAAGGEENGEPMLTTIHELRGHGHMEAAAALATKTLAWIRQLQPAHGEELRGYLPWLNYAAGDLREARRLTELWVARDTTYAFSLGVLGMISAEQGDRATARRVANRLAHMNDPKVQVDALMGRAGIVARLGERELAVSLLRDAMRAGFDGRILLHSTFEFVPLHGYEPFEVLARSVD